MELQDDTFSPFPSSTQKDYLTMPDPDRILAKNLDQSYESWPDFNFSINIELGNRIYTEKRVRYSIWNLISDVGGFSDGIYLVLRIFMTTYSGMAFKTNFLNRSYFDSDSNPREQQDVDYRNTFDDLQQGRCKVVGERLLKVISRALKAPAQLKQSFLKNIYCWYC